MNWIGLAASIAAAILLVLCVSLALAWRRLAAIKAQLNSLSGALHRLEGAESKSLIRSLNSPKSRNARKSPSPSSDALEERMTAPTQPDEKESTGSELHVVAPKTSPE